MLMGFSRYIVKGSATSAMNDLTPRPFEAHVHPKYRLKLTETELSTLYIYLVPPQLVICLYDQCGVAAALRGASRQSKQTDLYAANGVEYA